ncbi:alpha-hydroxy acid oxidase [Streptomyces sp. LHD-70]|uniref:alpha-hydroxy acid oxidase n=1 Tax=Streptomyces sp. LHD-70 TaxID=3072140 RepID=UPI00280DE321|nr:alpha-hydroxy acid oxidase [Streptomyces sp. LHD-70]MDQ8705538.1 alpha-hydroxy acid oxidase [Streptomyces sp. LHD-70]
MSAPVSINDFRCVARRRLPRIVYDYLEGGALDEITLRSNITDLAALHLRQSIMNDVSDIDLSTTVLGQTLRTPALISPMGLLSLFHRDADIALARAARDAGTVFVHSAWSGLPLKKVAAAAPGAVWCQAAIWPDQRLVDQHLDRAEAADVPVLVLAGDVSVSSKRERDLRNGFTMAARPSPRSVLNAARKPRWVANFLFGPRITFGDQTIEGRAMNLREMGEFLHDDNAAVSWDDVARIRKRWHGKLAVKGVMNAQDALRAVDAGADAIFVSNHGGRQFDAQPSTVSALAEIAQAVDGQAEVLVDSGIRRGSDLVKMRALGATAGLIGRPAVYGLVHSGQAGVAAVLDILRDEAATALAFTGNTTLNTLNTSALAPRSDTAHTRADSRTDVGC